MSSAWSLVNYTTANGQTSGSFTQSAPSGMTSQDLVVVVQQASSVGYDLGWASATPAFTHEVDISTTLATQEVRVWAKVAGNETQWTGLNSSGTPFYQFMILVFRWLGGYPNLGNLAAYRGTQDTQSNYSGASPVNSTYSNYTPSLAGDNLGIHVMSSRTNGSNTGLTITQGSGLTAIDNHNYADAHMTLATSYETQPTTFASKTAVYAYTAGGGSMSLMSGLLAMEQGVVSGSGDAWGWAN